MKRSKTIITSGVDVHSKLLEIIQRYGLVRLRSDVQAIEAIGVLRVFLGAILDQNFHNVNVSFPCCVVQSIELILLSFYVNPDEEFFGS